MLTLSAYQSQYNCNGFLWCSASLHGLRIWHLFYHVLADSN